MLLKVHGNSAIRPRLKSHLNGNLENMTITYYPELALFMQNIDLSGGAFTVTYSPPGQDSKKLEIPLEPEVADLEALDVSLHGSPTRAYKMSKEVNAWFSSCFGYEVIMAYIGPNLRPVLGNLSPNAVQEKATGNQSWLSSVTSSIPNILSSKPKIEDGLTFADCAAYLVVTEESIQDVSARLSDSIEVDVTKFRPNIVLSGASKAYEEDYWGVITVCSGSENGQLQEANLVLTANCLRCVSLNVDYSTGEFAKGEEGTVLKKLMKDRRVDKGKKYSPVFGRYGFLKSLASSHTIAVGDEVRVSKINEERTAFGKYRKDAEC